MEALGDSSVPASAVAGPLDHTCFFFCPMGHPRAGLGGLGQPRADLGRPPTLPHGAPGQAGGSNRCLKMRKLEDCERAAHLGTGDTGRLEVFFPKATVQKHLGSHTSL
jgi:hypothetical protein